MTHSEAAMSRRGVLYYATAAMGVGAAAAIAWPLIDQMNPDAHVLALGDAVSATVSDLSPGGQKIIRWRHIPIVVLRRTDEALAAMREPQFIGKLVDPYSRRRQQPDYVKNWHRSVRPEYGVTSGVCAHCNCVLHHDDKVARPDPIEHFICPCCASRYDSAGRGYYGPTQFNLAVPPYVFSDASTITVGKNPPGEFFNFASIERS